jgi:hypothetical protein
MAALAGRPGLQVAVSTAFLICSAYRHGTCHGDGQQDGERRPEKEPTMKKLFRALAVLGALAIVAPAYAASDTTGAQPAASPSAGGIKKNKKSNKKNRKNKKGDVQGESTSSPSAGGNTDATKTK